MVVFEKPGAFVIPKHMKKKNVPNLMIQLTIDDVKEMVNFAIQKGYKIRSKNIRYDSDGNPIYQYKETLHAVRYAIKRGYALPNNQSKVRKPNQRFGVSIVPNLKAYQ